MAFWFVRKGASVAAFILDIRWRLAGHRFAAHAPGCRLNIGCARRPVAVARPSAEHHDNLRNSLGIWDFADIGFMDAHHRNVGGPR